MEKPKLESNELDSLKTKYDAKENAEVRESRKKILLDQNPNIIQELGDEKWIDYLYNTPAPGELELYKDHLNKLLEETKQAGVDPEPQFDPKTGLLSTGFATEDEKEIAKSIIQKKIREVTLLLENS